MSEHEFIEVRLATFIEALLTNHSRAKECKWCGCSEIGYQETAFGLKFGPVKPCISADEKIIKGIIE